ncbi:MAG: hypothetical protein UZ20_WS6002000005 [candidate division WS6 bacterium OLB21]|uniref:Uncharacterized protein n=1 Tax=candidate division WS6 bacterium OLB21 TaxID=1617427 RepID=A0A136KLT4_9BACT|nr:MAG: hypothetical protein UZ20_WS6002000005 [candidate division WS6 bacterium OLB21]
MEIIGNQNRIISHEVSTDPVERLAIEVALEQGLIVYEAPMIKIVREKLRKGDKRSTVPDLLVLCSTDDPGIFVEVTIRNAKAARKNRQEAVMREAGLINRYAQVNASDITQAKEEGFYNMLLRKILERDS